jgi:hypothetical protein
MSTTSPDTRESARIAPPPTSPPPQAGAQPTPEAVLALVQTSPVYVAEHDRAGWLALFGSDGYIEDPVGSPPAPVADGTLGRFWDTFIAKHEIRFEVLRDYQVGRDVFRDVIIHTRIGKSVRVDVPAYLLYEVAESGKSVARMTAHWPLSSLSLGAMKMGPAAWVEMTKLFARMIKVMGPAWVGGYLSALWDGIGGRGPRVLARLGRAIGERDVPGIVDLFVDDQATAHLGRAEATARTLLGLFPPGSQLSFEAPVSAGWRTAFRFTRAGGAEPVAGLGLAEFAPGSTRLARLRLFPA